MATDAASVIHKRTQRYNDVTSFLSRAVGSNASRILLAKAQEWKEIKNVYLTEADIKPIHIFDTGENRKTVNSNMESMSELHSHYNIETSRDRPLDSVQVIEHD